MTCSWEGDSRCEHPAMRELAAIRAHIEAPEGDLVVAVDALVAAAVEVATAPFIDDQRLAAGELRVPIPEPGTDAARMLCANVIMRRERDQARAEVERLRGLLRRCDEDLQPPEPHYSRLCSCPGCDGYRALRRDIEEAIRG